MAKKKDDSGELRTVDSLALSPWLKSQIRDMEAVLKAASLPPDCWRDLFLDLGALTTQPDLSPENALSWWEKPLPPLVKFVRKHHESDEAGTRDVFFAAAIAAAANLALEHWRNSEDRLLLGICLERFWTLRKFDLDGVGRRTLSIFTSEGMKKHHDAKRRQLTPQNEARSFAAVRVKDLQAKGCGRNQALRTVYHDPRYRELCGPDLPPSWEALGQQLKRDKKAGR